MEFFFNTHNTNNNTTNNNNKNKHNYGDNKRHIHQSSMMTDKSNGRGFADFMNTENHLKKLTQKQTNDANWVQLEKLLEDGFEYEEALQQINKQNEKSTHKNNEKNYNNSKPKTFNRQFVHSSVITEDINWNNNVKKTPISKNKLCNPTREKPSLFSFGDFLSLNNTNVEDDNDKADKMHSKTILEHRQTNRDNTYSTSEDFKYTNIMFKNSEMCVTDPNDRDPDIHVISYADRRKLNLLLEDGHKYEDALSYVLKEKNEKSSHTVTHSSQDKLNEFAINNEFGNETWRRTNKINTEENNLYETMSHNDEVALIDEEIKRKRLALEEYENRLLRYSQRIITTEVSRSPSRDERDDDNYSTRRRMLSGAGRKRLKMLITHGLNYQEALSTVINERIERERRNGFRNKFTNKRENIDNRNDINYKRKKMEREEEDYGSLEEVSQNNTREYDNSRRKRHFSSSEEKDTEEQIRMKRLDENEKAKPLSGAGRKKISRLVAKGVPISKARDIVIKERDERNAKLSANAQQFSSDKHNQHIKAKQKQNIHLNGIKVYIHTRNYPDEELNNDELHLVKKAILHELNKVPPRAFKVKFLSCVFKLGWLQIICADDYSCDWLANKMKTIRPWKGAELKMIVPGQLTVMVHITESDSCRKILDILKKQNQGLRTENWIVLRIIQTKKGNLYIFDIDDFSLETLEKNNLTAFYGLGKVKFRLKNIVRKDPMPYEFNSTESRQSELEFDQLSNIRSEERLIYSPSRGIRGSEYSSEHSFH